MLSLDDSRWTTLTHAYGSAADIPDLIRSLAQAPAPQDDARSEPWFSIWSSLCHQDDVFDASYAAVPHIVDIACRSDGPVDFSFFQLPASVEVARRNGRGPALPADLAEAYDHSLEKLADCIARHRHEAWDEATLLSVLAAQAVAKGHHRIAEAIMNLDDDLIERLILLDFDA
ncbi:MAG: hypothetical protein J0H88_08000 [Sphingomonadales bacterium]|nr:hypothetical protein [Sphingomonadales bacterium]